ncbi:MAG: phosphoribosyltransferase, partial [Candidatus Bathyarchaeia archaeon]
TWSQVYNMLLKQADKIRRDKFKPDIIVGVCRGGWPPARVLSDLLGNANLANVKAEFYLGVAETKGEPTLTQPVSVKVADKKVLLVDEVADTGKSLRLVQQHIAQQGASQLKTATVYYKPWSLVKPDYYEKQTTKWVVFPWEIKETIRKIVNKNRKQGLSPREELEKLAKAGISAELIKKFWDEIAEEENC